MKIFRAIVLIVFLFTSAAYGFFYFYNSSRIDSTFPVISFSNTDEVLEVSVADNESALLNDVTAYDAKDGDLTGRVIVEQISNFIDKGVSNITYAVVDHDHHVAKAMRRIRYTDYKPPHFTFSQAMRFEIGTKFNVLDIIGAMDKLDGDLTKKIKLTSSDLSVNLPGVYHMHAQVTNSKGDIRYLKFNVTIYEGIRNEPKILLKDYLVYLHVGEEFDANSYVDKVILNDAVLDDTTVRYDSAVNTQITGIYQVDYDTKVAGGNTAKTSLVVVVEE